MPVEPPHDRPSPRPAWGRRAAQGSAAALAALTALGTVGPAQAAPAPAQSVHASQQTGSSSVTVRPGDSLWSLATAHGVTVTQLMAANDVPAHGMLRPGQRLTLPTATQAGAANERATRASTSMDGAERDDAARTGSHPVARHTVASGDTLWDLALRHGVSVADLAAANGLPAGAGLRPGQSLAVPAPDGAQSGRTTSSEDPLDTTDTAAAADTTAGARPAQGAAGSAPTGPTSMAGRTYPTEAVASADAHRAQLAARAQPSADELRELVRSTADSMGVDPALALAHASQESGFRHAVVSPADAVGTMQVVPAAGEWASAMVGQNLDLLDPRDNVTAGVAIIRELQDRAPSKDVGVAAYYQGLHGVQTYGMYPDTKAYVKAVSAQERDFAQ
ncbi:lytic transglycosylase domain-containing protein [Kocuria salsicia]|uniref:lytic transglycosylase domain-containing protein n=1 Tax=Kocuria salsicia TaxID=664639 RepID=UPI00119E0470|nr:lytic transglycosylase domain-containing protein [Kocuria salsicia]